MLYSMGPKNIYAKFVKPALNFSDKTPLIKIIYQM